MQIILSKKARRDMEQLTTATAVRIEKKLRWFAAQENPLAFSKRVQHPTQMLFRFRIGDYRAVFRLEGRTLEIIFILTVKHRRESYRDINITISYVPAMPPDAKNRESP
ncbi:MAG: type II toxin-antitoxin system RelE/ParE family toxin [Candidatus Peribacteraceae bacterium]|nr:type II toxin-antitoxin system RelE/ParE family toxin [Candidatus Peribacteraceae bacterium]